MKNHYVYKIVDLETNEFYIGSRTCSVDICDDLYMGSYVSWKPSNIKNLKKYILKSDFNNRNDAIKYEAQLIRDNINNSLNRNYHIPGEGFSTVGFITVYDENGNVFNISKEDERYINGEVYPTWKGRVHTELTKEKMKKAKIGYVPWNKNKKGVYTSDTIEKFRKSALNREPISDETKQKISKSLKGKMVGEKNPMYGRSGDKNPNFGNKWTPEQKLKQSIKLKEKVRGKKKPILQYDIYGNFIQEWECIKLACDELNLRASGISSVLTGRYTNCGGFVWKYKNKDK